MDDIYSYLKELTALDIEYADENNNSLVLSSHIKSLDEDKILIAPPTYEGRTYNIPDHSGITLNVTVSDGVHSAESRVLCRELSHTAGLWISYPLNSIFLQRREYYRVPLTFNMELFVYEDKEKTRQKVFNLVTKDISGSGFSCISDEPFSNYYEIECKIFIDDGKEPVYSKCDYIQQKTAYIDKKVKFVNAFAFVDIRPENVERIVKMGFKYQLDLRKRGLLGP